MNVDFLAWADTVLIVLIVLCFLVIFIFNISGSRESSDIPSDVKSHRMVEIMGPDKNDYILPSPEDIEEIEKCADSMESFTMDGNEPTDIELFSYGITDETRMREVIGNLLLSGMEVIDKDGKKLTLDQVIGQFGEAEEVVTEQNERCLFPDPDSTETRKDRMGRALERLRLENTQNNI